MYNEGAGSTGARRPAPGETIGRMVRLFIAVEISDEVREEIRRAQQVLRTTKARVSLVDPAIIHLTLKFLGEVDERLVVTISEALRGVRFERYEVEVGEVTGNNPRRPRVVWCRILDRGESSALHDRIDAALEPLGFPRETRPFTPHVTLARVKEFDPSLLPAIASLKGARFGKSEVYGFLLKKSTLTPKGPIYENLLEVGE